MRNLSYLRLLWIYGSQVSLRRYFIWLAVKELSLIQKPYIMCYVSMLWYLKLGSLTATQLFGIPLQQPSLWAVGLQGRGAFGAEPARDLLASRGKRPMKDPSCMELPNTRSHADIDRNMRAATCCRSGT